MNGPIHTSPRKAADPIVYHLARVVDDGTLVPATDTEIMAVENFIDNDKVEVHFLGLPPSENLKVGAENLDLSPVLELDSTNRDVQYQDKKHLHASDAIVDQSRNSDVFSRNYDGSADNDSSASAVGISSKPKFSLLEGEIHLDNLTIKDLQETFRATFGRETSVKDKQWLKRRIIMGLTNSCDFSVTTLLIIDNRVVKKGKGDIYKCVDSCGTVNRDIQSSMEGGNPTCSDNQMEIHSNSKGAMVESFLIQGSCGNKYDDKDERPAKRVRKPTKRYIEELSEEESRDVLAKTVSPVKQPSRFDHASVEVSVVSENYGLDGRCLMRHDSLGGSGVQIPYVSRIRRSRPRESFTNLMPVGIGTSAELVKNDLASIKQSDDENVNNDLEAGLSLKLIEVPISSPGESQQHTERIEVQLEEEVELDVVKFHSDNSDDELITVPTENGGMRRKHHRPWTLNEVVKLVEGVAKHGAGRWSEIKRSSFATFSYRTSVDLKDKWRNLLRASVADFSTRNEQTQISRKHASVLIPSQILLRVRELADIPTKGLPSLSAHLSGGFIDTNANHEAGSDQCGLVNI